MIKKKKTGAHSTVPDRSKNRRRRELSPDDDAFLGGSAGQEESAEETPAPAPGKRARHIIDHENDATENLPTGGITPALLASYLEVPEIACVGGTWLAKPADLKQAASSGDWSAIGKGIAEAAQAIANMHHD